MQRKYRQIRHYDMTYEINDTFNSFVENVSEYVLSNGELIMDESRLKKSFFNQLSDSPDNIDAMSLIDYGYAKPFIMSNIEDYPWLTYGLKIKGKDVLLSDIAYLLEDKEFVELIQKRIPILTVNEIEAAQRCLTGLILGFECNCNIIQE